MRIVLQRVKSASVSVSGKRIADIGIGYVLMLGVAAGDTQEDIDILTKKVVALRLFENESDKFDKDLAEVDGEILVVSQFTLFADCSKGRRPFFGEAEETGQAEALYEEFISKLKEVYSSDKVKSGKFAAKMLVEINNDGPVTIILDSR
ncbi:D-tyrosyl-tRNA(Tyr) deacylase [Candidatus Dojkabacteria bacterium]|nr:D-tyrosyl-tRNA(Tyr) deacylase [Candidatus Dojkabacteria bacterium]